MSRLPTSRLHMKWPALAVAVLLAACGGGGDGEGVQPQAGDTDTTMTREQAQRLVGSPLDLAGPRGLFNRKPGFVKGAVHTAAYDGTSDDLLTAGLGKSGLAGALPPFADGSNPTPTELRRAAIYNSYRAIVDMTAAGGYGTLYGPNVDADGHITTGEGKIPGIEVLAFSDDGSGLQNVVLMVQVPAHFNPRQPCIVTATSSGSRGVYGAISTGEWGLKRGCAVAYTDKGTGSAPHDLASDTVPLIDGTRTTTADAGDAAQFRAPLTPEQLAAVNSATPNRLAYKHAHSQRNPERDWGRFTLQAVEFAYWVLNERYGIHLGEHLTLRTLRPGNTLVIASSISNGGGAAIAAAEQDVDRLINGVAVSEPAVEVPADLSAITVRRGSAVQATGKPLVDFTTYANLFQSCAAISPQVATTPGRAFVITAFATNRCASLKAKGLLTADTVEAQADEALARLATYGWEPESVPLHASLAAFEVAPAVSVTFANALARASVADHLCGYSFAATTAQGLVTPTTPALLAPMAATGNGVPPSAGIQLINNLSPGVPLRDLFSFSPSTFVQDFNLDGALCLRGLLAGSDAPALALQQGLNETRMSGNLRGKPALIVHGRADALLPVNHTSRPYTALNKTVEGRQSRLSYIEVTNAQHFDGFIGLPTLLPGYDTRYVPLHVYLNRGLDAMYAHLRHGTPLPQSQVVRTAPRGGVPGAAPAITEAHVPPIVQRPSAADAITWHQRTLTVPD